MRAPPCSIRPEEAADAPAIHRLVELAFGRPAEAVLVDRLRAHARLAVSLAAIHEGQVVGHVAFSPVSVDGRDAAGVGLAPLAVLPEHQGRGIGGALVRAGLEACRDAGWGFAVVLGEPAYYGRFGFTRASDRGLANEYGVDDPFMVMELRPGGCPPYVGGGGPGGPATSGGGGRGGLVRYAAEFAELPE